MENMENMENMESMTNTKATKEKSRREKKQPKWKWLIVGIAAVVLAVTVFWKTKELLRERKRDRSQNPTKSGYAGSTGCNDFSRTK